MPESMAEVRFADDPDGLTDSFNVPPVIGPQLEVVPEQTEKEIWEQMLRTLGYEAWNEAVAAQREANGGSWSPDLSGLDFSEMNLEYRDLSGIDFRGTRLGYCRFNRADMNDTIFDATSYVYGASFRYTKLAGSNLRVASGLDGAGGLDHAIDYTPPLRDVTRETAHHFLMEAIADEDSFINEGLQALRDDGFALYWEEDKLKFYLSTEIQRFRDLCKEGACDCEIEHCCSGECSCCACYTGNCDCTPDHEGSENVETDEWYLSTIVGHIEMQWNSHLGFIGNVVMDRRSLHPHVSTGASICWGDAQMPRSIKPIDYFIVMMGWVGQHNPTDPYREIEDLPRIR